ncbi:putative acetyltransferase [Symmachiella dynata]|uniref:Putative acetyltransferase n=1 Tax=Symmachiella dynata TaxID=2527995 RepID=A0A517ZLU3_9PLAN|nr:GNAT family N-acetyltransferase [Symmachiella dynata]QDU43461.1 putative acetyltransferase [Symmachiella dynata]
MRHASASDLEFIAESFVKIPRFMQSGETDAYIAALPTQVDDSIRELASRYICDDDRIALVVESEGQLIACLLGEIRQPSLTAANLGDVGFISICWVEPQFRNSGCAAKLVSEAEEWFCSRGIELLEVSYMAKNETAANVWQQLGFEPFRVLAYKSLAGD